jgi:hypothetical protein
MAEVIAEESSTNHDLYDKWTLWAHLPHDTDWTLKSYKRIFEFDTVEHAITLTETLPEKLIKNCMLFIMRKGIQPTWEDEKNLSGGCFSYKINNKYVKETWTALTYRLTGETITNDTSLSKIINGITISPKKNFCIIKIWTNICSHQTATIIKPYKELIIPHGCLFKKHKQ